LDLELPVQSVRITAKLMSLNFMARCTRYNIMWWSFQWLATGRCFSPSTPVPSTNKTDRHDITEILLKVVLNTINQPIINKLANLNEEKNRTCSKSMTVNIQVEIEWFCVMLIIYFLYFFWIPGFGMLNNKRRKN
jgi:hypothetical protein